MAWYNTIVNATLNIDKAGRIVLPKPVRDELQLSAGDALELEVSEDRIVLRPARVKPRLYKKKGVWVLHTGVPLSAGAVKETVRKIRQEREDKFLDKRQ
jgi:AbrB family looped-hinge helix DNA binding protein